MPATPPANGGRRVRGNRLTPPPEELTLNVEERVVKLSEQDRRDIARAREILHRDHGLSAADLADQVGLLLASLAVLLDMVDPAGRETAALR